MTALRWFLSYLLPMLVLASIATSYYFRDKISSDWYRTLSWPVSQISAVLEKQKLQLNGVNPVIASEITLPAAIAKNSSPDKTTSNKIQPLIHPVETTEKLSSDSEVPRRHPIIQDRPENTILPKRALKELETERPKPIPNITRPKEKLALAQQMRPYFVPPVIRPATPRFNVPNYNLTPRPIPKPPTRFKLNKKQQKLLYQARKAYWTKNFKLAKKHYLTLSSRLPDNPDIHGELGNLFLFEGKIESAIKHYSLAANLLVKHRHFWKLPRIMQLISKYNPEKSNEVMQLMRNRYNPTQKNTEIVNGKTGN